MDLLFIVLLFVAFFNWSMKRRMRQHPGRPKDMRGFLAHIQQEVEAAEQAVLEKTAEGRERIEGAQSRYQKMSQPPNRRTILSMPGRSEKTPPERVRLDSVPKKKKPIELRREGGLGHLNTRTRLTPKKSRLTKSRYASRSIKVGEDPNAPQLEIIEDPKSVSLQGDIREGIIWQQILNRPVAYGRHHPLK